MVVFNNGLKQTFRTYWILNLQPAAIYFPFLRLGLTRRGDKLMPLVIRQDATRQNGHDLLTPSLGAPALNQ